MTMIKPFDQPIYVARPFLPPIEKFCKGLHEIWNNHWLTNDGPILRRYASQLRSYFQTDNLCLFVNGTSALQIGLHGMGISGEVITTPFSFVATTHALYWNRIRPVFADIESEYYTIDPEQVERAITPLTEAILAVHVFGHPCRLKELSEISDRYGIKLIYDAAHAFGVKVDNQSIAQFGDMSMFSFHATKPYHSIEGGMLCFQDPNLRSKFEYLRNFGFKNETEVIIPGTNAKMNEMQALMGSLVLSSLDMISDRNRSITALYKDLLVDTPGITFTTSLPDSVQYNFAYIPIQVDTKGFGMSRDDLYSTLKEFNIYTRRYFYPLICDFSCYRNIPINTSLSVARRLADRILVLPMYSDLELDAVERICDIIRFIHRTRRGKRSGN